jgi:multidrug efflux pump subunit AcrB
MSFNLSAIAVRERAVTLFFILLLAAAGVYAFVKLGRAEDPNFTIKVLTVTAVWPGATAREMQDLVAEPLEKRIQELTWYDRVETMTRPGYAFLTVTLKDSTPPSEVQEEFYQARKKLGDEARNLPPGVLGPFVNDEYSDVSFGLYALKAKGMPMRELVRRAEDIRQDLLHVPGVKKINILGERPEQIFVEFSFAKLATLGVSAQDIAMALQRQNTVTPAGSIDTRGPQVFIRFDGAYDSLQAIADTPIVAGGRTVRLSDVAEIRRGYEDPATFVIRHEGEPVIVLAAVMQQGWNGLALGKALEEKTAAIAQTLPLGLTLSKVSDQAVNIEEAVGEFMMKFAMALGVVLLVSLLSLGWRVGIVVAAAVPLTLAVVFLVMLETGRFFDRITLGALILALGLLVDDAIIIIEVMVVKMEEGMDRINAAAYAWSHTAAPMLSGTLVTIAAFLPVGFCSVNRRRICGQHFLGRRLRADRLLDRCGRLHPVLGRQVAASDQTDRGRLSRYLRHAELSSPARRDRHRRPPQIPDLRDRRRGADCIGRRDGDGEAAILPGLGSPRSAGRGSSPRRHEHRNDDHGGRETRELAAEAAGIEDPHELYRARRAALLLCDGAGTARPGVRQDGRPDA